MLHSGVWASLLPLAVFFFLGISTTLHRIYLTEYQYLCSLLFGSVITMSMICAL
jgi:hypothetical protein